MKNVTHSWIYTIKPFPPKNRALVLMFKTGQVRPTPVIPPLVVRPSFKEGKRQERGSEHGPSIVYKWFAVKKMSMSDKWLSLLSNE